MTFPTIFLLLFCVTSLGQAIEIGATDYFLPEQYLSEIISRPDHPANRHDEALRRAFNATIFLPKRGTASLISDQGLVVTAAHVIAHKVIGETKDCGKIVFHLNHQLAQGGQLERPILLPCEEVLIYNYNADFALLRVRPPSDLPQLPYMPIASGEQSSEERFVIIAGHPHAMDYAQSFKVVSEGKIFFDGSGDPDLPHFLHLVDTEGGHSGSPVLTSKGELLGIHFRGIPNYGPGVIGTVEGERQKLHRFNVAIFLPYFVKKYSQWFAK
ncbi:MAG: trypsin-like peptidase domain-containing protein [Bdellovibrio sp.]|nr:trypsin-like peptidase domain-containing protein [Bdellovibrio sp.]